MGGGLVLLTWLFRRRPPLRKRRAQHLRGDLTWIGATTSGEPLCCRYWPFSSPFGSRLQSPEHPLAPKAGCAHGDSKGLERQKEKETFPVWERAPRAEGIYSSACSPGQPLHLLQPLQLNHGPGLGRERTGVTAKGEEFPLCALQTLPQPAPQGSAPSCHQHNLTRREREQMLERQGLQNTGEAAGVGRQG